MRRTTVMFDEETYARLQEIARRQATTSSALIREAVGRYVTEASETTTSPLEALIGMFDGPDSDAAARTEEIVAEVIGAKFPGRVG